VLAGDLHHRVGYDILALGPASEYGDSAQVWSHLASLWADVEFLSGNELLKAKQIHEQAKVRITIRYNPAVTSAGRFTFEGSNYYPADVLPDSLKRKMVCTCYVRPNENVT
jgi:SPP1 family predicted phage head-tail adaptor